MQHDDGMTMAERWEQRYRDGEMRWGTSVNPALADAAARLDLVPGRALDIGAGHGGDAVFLASLGWDVVAVDISPTALTRVASLAQDRGVADRVATEVHDVSQTLPEGPFALIAAAFVHSHDEFDRDAALREASTRLSEGGALVVIDHGSAAPWMGHHAHWEFLSPAETWARLALGDGFSLEQAESIERTATGPSGETAPLIDTVIVARRDA